MANQNNSLLDFEDPGALPKELMDVPGFVNELKNHTMAVAALAPSGMGKEEPRA